MSKTVARKRDMMTKEMVEDYTGYDNSIITGAYKRGELKGEKPGGSLRSRVYFDRAEVDRWLDSLAEDETA